MPPAILYLQSGMVMQIMQTKYPMVKTCHKSLPPLFQLLFHQSHLLHGGESTSSLSLPSHAASSFPPLSLTQKLLSNTTNMDWFLSAFQVVAAQQKIQMYGAC